MPSSDEIFEKFLKWKTSRILLKATRWPTGINSFPEIHMPVTVFTVQEMVRVIGFMTESRPITHFELQVRRATKSDDGKSVDVFTEHNDRWVIEEISAS